MNAGGKAENPATPPRRRSFLANRRDEIPGAGAFPAETEEDDIPVLTEIVAVGEEPPETPAAGAPEADSPPPPDASLEELAAQMTQAIQEQMAYELPTLIEATLLNISEELRSGITSTMEAALRDFVARRK
ncbi:MAG: hypothetical protein LBI87_07025 [Candidatus Accumulibacter sp.]|jgi:hypothetical protein|nr:hypothetical protein [Accumulibacter sp.]